MQRCTSCPRAGDDLGTCGAHSGLCGQAKEVDPKKDIVVHCGFCDKTRAFSLVDVIHNRQPLRLEMSCQKGRATCQARQVALKGHKADV